MISMTWHAYAALKISSLLVGVGSCAVAEVQRKRPTLKTRTRHSCGGIYTGTGVPAARADFRWQILHWRNPC